VTDDTLSDWGPPPDPEEIAELIAERYGVEPPGNLSGAVKGDCLEMRLTHAPREYRILVEYMEGASEEEDPWHLMAVAADALIGMLIESGFAYRELPIGRGIQFENALFAVEVECTRPDLVAQADALLSRVSEVEE
jgi:hypothetical protein